MDDQFDVPLEDAELLDEVELTTSLMIAASESDEPLCQRRDRPAARAVPSPRSRVAADPVVRRRSGPSYRRTSPGCAAIARDLAT